MSAQDNEHLVGATWRVVRRVLVVCAFLAVIGFAVTSRMQVVNDCRDLNVRLGDAAERAKVQRVFLDTAADAHDAAFERDGFASDRRAAHKYRELIRRTKVPQPVDCPTFWHN